MRVLSLFSGIGGLDIGIKIAVPELRTICCVEADGYCQRVLAARMLDGSLDACPIHGDVRTFDGRPWRGRVDLIAGGFPCQDISNAGQRAGIRTGNKSGLWYEFRRIIGEVGSGLVFVENVSALPFRGMDIVLGDLCDLGFDAEWGTVSACAVGAPHVRQRMFILAYSPGIGRLGRLVARNGAAEACGKEPSEWGEDRQFSEMGAAVSGGIRTTGRWYSQPPIQRMADRSPEAMDRLRSLGNAVVPLQAALALVRLAERIAP